MAEDREYVIIAAKVLELSKIIDRVETDQIVLIEKVNKRFERLESVKSDIETLNKMFISLDMKLESRTMWHILKNFYRHNRLNCLSAE